jgi:hypothetical protein
MATSKGNSYHGAYIYRLASSLEEICVNHNLVTVLIKMCYEARHWWLVPVILAPQEAVIKRIVV